MVGYLVDQGVPEPAAERYATALNRGDILVAVRSSAMTDLEAQETLSKYGAIEVFAYTVGAPVDGVVEPPIVDTVADVREATDPVPAATPSRI